MEPKVQLHIAEQSNEAGSKQAQPEQSNEAGSKQVQPEQSNEAGSKQSQPEQPEALSKLCWRH